MAVLVIAVKNTRSGRTGADPAGRATDRVRAKEERMPPKAVKALASESTKLLKGAMSPKYSVKSIAGMLSNVCCMRTEPSVGVVVEVEEKDLVGVEVRVAEEDGEEDEVGAPNAVAKGDGLGL